MSSRVKSLLVCIGLLFCMFLLSGCRESTVIEKIIYDQNVSEQDMQNNQKVISNRDDSNVEDDKIEKKKNTDNSKRKEKNHKIASKKTNEKNNESVAKNRYNSDSKTTAKADSNNKRNDKNKKGENKGNNKDKDSQNKNNNKNQGSASGGSDGGREVILPNGEKVNLPEEVNSIVAAGDAAIIAEMLGGTGIVTGADSGLISDSLRSRVFNGDLTRAKPYWTDNGDNPMSNSAFQSLLKSKPDACLIMEGSSSFSANQIQTLRRNGIACVTIPSMNTYDGTINAVKTVGTIIGNRTKKTGGLNAKKKASEYEEFCIDLIADVKGKSGGIFSGGIDFNNNYFLNGRKSVRNQTNGKYTAFISGWDYESGFTIRKDNGELLYQEAGVAVVPYGYSMSPLSYYMSVGGVCNKAALLGESDCRTYAEIPLNINVHNFNIMGSAESYNSTDKAIKVGSGDSAIRLGESRFKSIIVDSNDTKDKIRNSEAWRRYGMEKDLNGGSESVRDYGFLGSDGMTLVRSEIIYDYDVIVNPSGVCSWTEGSVEAILESPWICRKINNKGSDSWMKEKIKDFYKSFYRHDLSGEELNQILQGK